MKKQLTMKAGLVAGLFFLLSGSVAFATTFGPIPVVDQAENAQYVVRGIVDGAGSVRNERSVNRPYTYWRLHVTSQQLGRTLPTELEVREPGGEIGEFGYHIAGSAEFNAGEDTFIFLRDTDEAAKEVIGLASGKYRVEVAPNGRKVVVSGLGLPVTGEDGASFSPDDFAALVQRVEKKESTAADRNIFVNRRAMHEHGEEKDENLQAGMKAAAEMLKRRPAESGLSSETAAKTETVSQTLPGKLPGSQTNTLTETPPPSEEQSTASSNAGWILAGLFCIGLLLGLILYFRR